MTTFSFRKPSALPGFGADARHHGGLFEPRGADSARGDVPQDGHARLGRSSCALSRAPRVLASYRLTFARGARGALINAVFGLLRRVGAGALHVSRPSASSTRSSTCRSRCRRPSRAFRSRPSMRGNGWIGQCLVPLGIKVAFTPLGVLVALTFIGLPFVVRTVQPVLEDFEREQEEAAACLGATRWQTFRRVVLPALVRRRC